MLVLASGLGFWRNRQPEPDLSISGVKPGMTEPEVEALLDGAVLKRETATDGIRMLSFQDPTGQPVCIDLDQDGRVKQVFGRLCLEGRTAASDRLDLAEVIQHLEPKLGPPDRRIGNGPQFVVYYPRYDLLLAQDSANWIARLGGDEP
ncbi:MAG: hypothetical protein AB7S38_40665 [Vulcanimicrobiota bacterium]